MPKVSRWHYEILAKMEGCLKAKLEKLNLGTYQTAIILTTVRENLTPFYDENPLYDLEKYNNAVEKAYLENLKEI